MSECKGAEGIQDALDGMQRTARGVAHTLMALAELAGAGAVTPPEALDVLAEALFRAREDLERARGALDARGNAGA